MRSRCKSLISQCHAADEFVVAVGSWLAILIFREHRKTPDFAVSGRFLLPVLATLCFSGSREHVKGLYQKRGWWYYQAPKPKDAERPKAVALQTQDEVTAINSVTDMQWNGMILEAELKDTLEVVLPRYYAAKAEDRKSSRRGRKVILDGFMNRMGNPRVTDISREMILEWRVLLATSGGTATSVKRCSQTSMTSYLIVLKAFLNWCVRERILRKSPAVDLGKQATVRKTRRQEFHTLEERERLLVKSGKDYVDLIVRLGFFAGLRIGEMLVINPDWIYISADGLHGSLRVQATPIELTDGSKVLWEPKTARGVRTIPIHPRLLEFLKDYGMRRPYLLAPDKTLFPPDEKQSLRFDAKKALANHAKAQGVKKTGYHMLRHSFGTHLAMGGAPMAEIAGLLGNTVKVCEDAYAGYSPRTKNLLPGI